MFNRDDANQKPLRAPEGRTPAGGRPALIGSSIAVRGELVGREDLTIDGTFEGEIRVAGCLVTIGSNGQVEGRIHAKVIAVEGRIKGDLVAEDQVVVRASGTMEGDIQAPRVALDEGCQFKGNIDMEPGREKPSKPSPPQDAQPDPAASASEPASAPEGEPSEEDAQENSDEDDQESTSQEPATPSDDSSNLSNSANSGRGRHNRRNRRR